MLPEAGTQFPRPKGYLRRAGSIIAPLPPTISMEVNRIFFDKEPGRLPETAAMEVELKNFKENFSL